MATGAVAGRVATKANSLLEKTVGRSRASGSAHRPALLLFLQGNSFRRHRNDSPLAVFGRAIKVLERPAKRNPIHDFAGRVQNPVASLQWTNGHSRGVSDRRAYHAGDRAAHWFIR